MEVKYRRRINVHTDTLGLRAFLEKAHYNAPFGLLVTMDDDVAVPDPRSSPSPSDRCCWSGEELSRSALPSLPLQVTARPAAAAARANR